MIDTHTHLFDSQFDTDRDDAILRATQGGVTHFILPAIDSDSHPALLALAAKNPACLPTIGLHPTSVNDNPNYLQELEIVHNYLFNSDIPFVAVGEIGLDLYWSKDFVEQQIEALKKQVEWAIEKQLPVILHVRDAWSEIFQTLEPYKGRLKGVFHSFSGTHNDYLQTQQLGDFYIGIGGPLTYKKSTLPEIVAHIPIEHIILETDSPYLPPTPHRGKRNESSYLPLIASKIAEIKDLPTEQVDEITTTNARKLFGI